MYICSNVYIHTFVNVMHKKLSLVSLIRLNWKNDLNRRYYVHSLAFPHIVKLRIKIKLGMLTVAVSRAHVEMSAIPKLIVTDVYRLFLFHIDQHMRSHSREWLKCASCYGVQITISFYDHNDTFDK